MQTNLIESKFFSQQFPILTRDCNHFYINHYCKNLFIYDVNEIKDEFANLNIFCKTYRLVKAFMYYKFIAAFSPELTNKYNKVKLLKNNITSYILCEQFNGGEKKESEYTTTANEGNESG